MDSINEVTIEPGEPIKENWWERLLVEHAQVKTRLEALQAFIKSDKFALQPLLQRELLEVQEGYMRGYVTVLRERINNSPAPEQQSDGTIYPDYD